MASRTLSSMVLAALIFGRAAAAEQPFYDWCSAYIDNPETSYADVACTPTWPAETVRHASTFSIGGPYDAFQGGATFTDTACFGAQSHAANRTWLEENGALGLGVHADRFDILTPQMMRMPGFSHTFLVDTATDWDTGVVAFFTGDASADCGAPGGCTWSDSYGANSTTNPVGQRMRDYIDASGGTGTYKTKVCYLAKGETSPARTDWYCSGYLADMSNASYRAWRVALSSQELAEGGYGYVGLNNKFAQYWDSTNKVVVQNWLNGVGACGSNPDPTDVTKLNGCDSGGSRFSAPPSTYGYEAYATGWYAMASDLHDAGVPFSVEPVSPRPFYDPSIYDNSATVGTNESDKIRDALYLADQVVLDECCSSRVGGWILNALRSVGTKTITTNTACGKRSASLVMPFLTPVTTATGKAAGSRHGF